MEMKKIETEGFLRATKLFNLEKVNGFCKIHGSFETWKRKGGDTFCPKCIEVENTLNAKTDAERLMLFNSLSKIDGIPKRYENVGFKNYRVTAENKNIFNALLNFAREPKNKWLFLLGKNGTGKTHLAFSVLKTTGGIYREFDDIANEFLDIQDGCGEVGRIQTIKKYASTPMLVIDEIEKVKGTEGRISWLNNILRKRYDNLLPLIICGNTDMQELCKNIEIKQGRALRDRIEEVGDVLNFNWESYRKNLREN